MKSIIDDVAAGKRKATDLLELKILEPAMGAAAFQNEVINQLAEAYLTYQQQQQRERGLKNWRIQPDKYRDELQKVKAFIATHNVYGVDLNPTAIELGKLSLWLNVIHKDMETPFFANRLAVGNAVIGAWLKVYSRDDVKGIVERQGRPLKQNKWWEKAPHKVKFFQNRVNRSVNDVYHFLLPDANMLGVRSIKEQKQAHKNEYDRMTTLLKDWTAPITGDDFKTLQRLSSKIDLLLKEYYTDQLSIDKYTNNRNEVWDGIEHADTSSLFKEEEQAESYAKKQQLFDTRYRRDNAYRKLKLAMDYWCALWFWEYDDANDLPTRQEYWADIEALLDVDNDKLDKRTRQALEQAGSDYAAEDMLEYGTRMTEEESEIVTKTQEELLTESHGSLTLFADDEPLRLKIADRLAKRYRFFHPMLEFIEVFWLRDGFDIICGNPPWIKLEFDEQGIMSEKYPEVVIRRMSAPDMRQKLADMFASNENLKLLYHSEEIENVCTGVFLNAHQNYPLLVGQQTNLYKCILENGFTMLSNNGFMGLLHPETVYDDPNGQPLRKEMYHRLAYHFQYQNAFNLFEIGHREKYSSNIYGSYTDEICFENINNLFHPSTVDACFAHDGHGVCGGIKIDDAWNTTGHRDRIVHFTESELRVLSAAFENGADWETTKLVSIHAKDILDVLQKFSEFPNHVENFISNTTVDLDETGAVNDGIIERKTFYPNINDYEMVYNGPQIFVANPSYKTPRSSCANKADFDTIDLSSMGDEYIARSNYKPCLPLNEFKTLVKGFKIGQDANGNDVYDNWIDYYKVGFRKMINLAGERSLICAVLPRRTAHINGVISTAFRSGYDTVDMAALCAAVPMDAYMKIMASQNLTSVRIQGFPLGVDDKYKASLRIRTLQLNCLTKYYSELWSEVWDDKYLSDSWSKEDERLHSFASLTESWTHSTPLRNYFERRQALVEIDVLTAMALGLSLDNLETIYTIYFPVLQQNENDTWYDAEGKIVFTCSKGLTGVGLDRPAWNAMRGNPITDADGIIIAYEGAEPQYTHTIDPRKSELYGGQQQTFIAPYNRCDRIADYRTAWAHFEKKFNQ